MLRRQILMILHKHQAFPDFWVRRNGINTLATAENSPSPSAEKGYVVSCLVNSCELPPEKAISASKSVHFDGPDRPNAVVNFLQKQGISETEVPTIVSRHPDLLTRSFKRRVAPVYNFVKDIIGIGRADTVLRRGSWIFNLDLESRINVPNVDLLREVGVPQQFIEFALVYCTRILFSDRVKFKRIVEEVKQMEFNPLKPTTFKRKYLNSMMFISQRKRVV
ncbi:hypothetical protein C2S53_015825 [Perilla frutescens var. hirtella]|uniref:Uncharacterized protein n=1 Tax=Perilla frutescens var. hirtella TaxID=608512 RepID=A0AAD4P0L9_PERFH|nr:hypothetical protein C2S53_015825 [Perilla frutescens var. hirtella]